MKRFAVLCVCLALAGCAAEPTWRRGSAPIDGMELARYECTQATRVAPSEYYAGYGGLLGVAHILAVKSSREKLFKECMATRGYVPNK